VDVMPVGTTHATYAIIPGVRMCPRKSSETHTTTPGPWVNILSMGEMNTLANVKDQLMGCV